jgi:hypothetical protein
MKAARRLIAGLYLLMMAVQPTVAESIQLVQSGGVFMLPVRINDAVVIPFVLDSGAAEITIPADVFLTLRRSGTVSQADFMGTGTYITADGSRHSSDRFLLHKVVVGNHVISNVVANVAPVTGSPLLGQTFLSRLPGWSIDNARHILVLNDLVGPAPAQPSAGTAANSYRTVRLIAQLGPVSPAIKDGKGTASLSLDTATKTVSWVVVYAGMAPPAAGAFMIPGPKPADDPTALALALPSNMGSPISGAANLTDQQMAGLQSGAWWIMFGSKSGPEIGGQIKVAP